MCFVLTLIGEGDEDGETEEGALEAILQALLAGEGTDALWELLGKVHEIDDNDNSESRFKHESLGSRYEHALNEAKKYTHTRVICSFTVNPTLQYNSNIHVALVPDTVRKGDIICYVVGCNIPIVLHPVGEDYEVLGEAFAQELVNEENLRYINTDSRESEEFNIQ
jgi:hypothetical protein